MEKNKTNKKVLSLLGTGHAVTDINQGVLPMMLAFLQPVFALTQLQVGLVTFVFNLSSSVIQPVFGGLGDRFRTAWQVPLGCLVAGLGMALTGFSSSYPVLLFFVLISGLGVAAYHPEATKFARFASGKRKASGMSIFSIGGNIGFAVGPVLASFFFGLAGMGGSISLLLLNGTMAFFLWFYLSSIINTKPAAAASNIMQETKDAGQCSRVLITPPVILLVLIVIIRSCIHFGMVTYLPQYYVNYLHHSEAYAATLTSIFLFAGAAGTLVGGPAADRLGLKNVMIGSMVLLIPLLYLFTITSGFWITILVALIGFAVISTLAVTLVFGHELMPENIGFISGLMMGFGVGMGGVGTAILGWVADTWGLPMVFYAMTILPVIALILTIFLPKK
ncbi:MAG: MFS transporter [Clostridiales bacterium]|nr:MFS transporter [Clostridiales bacterium]MCF8022304.1 MFS transporter [Clostridiales bacterium]